MGEQSSNCCLGSAGCGGPWLSTGGHEWGPALGSGAPSSSGRGWAETAPLVRWPASAGPLGEGECLRQLMAPGPGGGDPQAEVAASAGEAGCCVQQPESEFLRLGGGQLTVQQ